MEINGVINPTPPVASSPTLTSRDSHATSSDEFSNSANAANAAAPNNAPAQEISQAANRPIQLPGSSDPDNDVLDAIVALTATFSTPAVTAIVSDQVAKIAQMHDQIKTSTKAPEPAPASAKIQTAPAPNPAPIESAPAAPPKAVQVAQAATAPAPAPKPAAQYHASVPAAHSVDSYA